MRSIMLIILGLFSLQFTSVNCGALNPASIDSLKTDTLASSNQCGKTWRMATAFKNIQWSQGYWDLYWVRTGSAYQLNREVTVTKDTIDNGILSTQIVDISPFPVQWSDTSIVIHDPQQLLSNDSCFVVLSEICNSLSP